MGSNRFRNWFIELWQPALSYAAWSLASLAVLTYKLGSLVPGLSLAEQAAVHSHSFAQIKVEPFYLFHKLLQLVSEKVLGQSFLSVRLASVVFAVLFTGCFFFTLLHWFNRRVAFVSSILFVLSAWFLHTARSADTTVMYLLTPSLTALGVLTRHKQLKRWFVWCLFGFAIVLMYTPGMIWFAVIAAVWQRKVLQRLMRTYRLWTLLSAVITSCALLPLVYAFIHDHRLALLLVGIPYEGLPPLQAIANNFIQTPWQLLVRATYAPAIWLGRMPLLDFGSTLLAILGLYSFLLDWRLDRSKVVIGGILVSWILISLGVAPMALLLPFSFLLVAGGIAFMLEQWFRVFPRNPFARNLAYLLLAFAVLTVSWYNVQHYFIAWPQTPATRSSLNQPL